MNRRDLLKGLIGGTAAAIVLPSDETVRRFWRGWTPTTAARDTVIIDGTEFSGLYRTDRVDARMDYPLERYDALPALMDLAFGPKTIVEEYPGYPLESTWVTFSTKNGGIFSAPLRTDEDLFANEDLSVISFQTFSNEWEYIDHGGKVYFNPKDRNHPEYIPLPFNK